ncbi:MAG: Ig-like domain-containing protein [Bacteroidales bacterium]|nr:Ig-like domain-containing protein [Bacteroidales bacterium]
MADAAHGTPDYKTILDLEDDAAHAVWGDAWRMPSKEEFQELRNNCTWTWTTLGGVNGYNITSKKSGYTGNFIFLPAAGMMSGSKVQNAGTEGDYWSSSLYTTESCSSWSPYFTSSEFSTGDCYRYFGLPVRAVYGEVVPVAEIELNASSIDLQPGESSQLIANILPGNAINNSLIWVSSDDSIATVDSQGLVTAVSLGTANTSVYSANGVFAACRVSVSSNMLPGLNWIKIT